MEAHGVREHPDGTVRGRFVRHALQAAETDVIVPAFAEHLVAEPIAGTPPTRNMAGRGTVYHEGADTAAGRTMNELLTSLGAPGGHRDPTRCGGRCPIVSGPLPTRIVAQT